MARLWSGYLFFVCWLGCAAQISAERVLRDFYARDMRLLQDRVYMLRARGGRRGRDVQKCALRACVASSCAIICFFLRGAIGRHFCMQHISPKNAIDRDLETLARMFGEFPDRYGTFCRMCGLLKMSDVN